MDDNKFEELISKALDTLPKEFAKKLDNVSITFQDFPTEYQLKKSKLPKNVLLLGLYEGVPQTKRGIYYSHIPDKITIFKKAIESIAMTEEEIKEQVKQTVVHEIGHHFGLGDEQLK